MGELSPAYSVQVNDDKLEKSWNQFRSKKDPITGKMSEYALSYSIFHAFRKQHLISVCLNFLASFLELMSPFFVQRIVTFISD